MQVEENHISPPFVIISPDDHVDSVRNYLVENDYFGFENQKVQYIVLLRVYVGALCFAKKTGVQCDYSFPFFHLIVWQFH